LIITQIYDLRQLMTFQQTKNRPTIFGGLSLLKNFSICCVLHHNYRN